MILLTACESTPINKAEYSYSPPPDYLLEPCVIHDILGDTVRDALIQSASNIESLKLCNQDKETIKEYIKSKQKQEGE